MHCGTANITTKPVFITYYTCGLHLLSFYYSRKSTLSFSPQQKVFYILLACLDKPIIWKYFTIIIIFPISSFKFYACLHTGTFLHYATVITLHHQVLCLFVFSSQPQHRCEGIPLLIFCRDLYALRHKRVALFFREITQKQLSQ